MKPAAQPLTDKARIAALSSLGLVTVAKHLGVQIPSLKFESIVDKDGKSVGVKVQNHWNHEKHGKSFTMDVKNDGAHLRMLGHDRIVFVNYDDSKAVQLWEVVDKDTSLMQYVGGYGGYGMQDMKRLVIIFPVSKMKLLASIEDGLLLSEMKKLSNAKKFNLDSKHYGRAAA